MSKLPFSYKEYKSQVGAIKARQTLLKTYQECQSIKQTAKAWDCHKQTVRIALVKKANHDLKDNDRTPINQPSKTPVEVEEKVKAIRLDTGYGKVRLSREMKTQHAIEMPASTIGKIINRLDLPKKPYRNAWRRKTRKKYDAGSLEQFERNEVDTKEILDKKGLSKQVYDYFAKSKHVPKYQWTWIDVASRIRFLYFPPETGQHAKIPT